ncbi:GAF domain-containing protein [Rhodopseudomonas palustris]|uniref:GAF domain-containing protein n=1 Tax=Rhodopseudomonas palustris TaxID=1076 RepID=UPI0022F0BDF9|nr:GAF domain-containing protein [Rhodopseudomonas palustris]WBU29181.1 GAF domain-containing protein [Rhodopseudomonas palustris]
MSEAGAERPSPPRWDEQERLSALERYGILDTPREPDFDDIVQLAADTFGAPIAAVNLIASGRQWFKAEIGLGARELPLDVSICAHAIVQSGTMVVPDTRQDTRFVDNPLVTAAGGLRFYAGALLKTPEGLPLGTVCVLDREPRPAGISDLQRRTLEVLARLVMTQLEMRRVIALQDAHARQLEAEMRERKHAEAARRSSDDRYRALFNSIDTGFCIIEVAFGADGTASDYQFIETNSAFMQQTGLADVEGKWMRQLAPGHEQYWFDTYGEVARSGIPIRFKKPAKALDDRWFDVHAFRIGDPSDRLVAVLFNDITARRRGELRRDALLKMGDQLRSLTTIQDMTGAASEIVGRALGAVRAGFGRVDPGEESVIIENDWSAAGYASLAGWHSLSDHPSFETANATKQPVVVADVAAAPPDNLSSQAKDDPGIGSLAVIPIENHDGSTALFFVHVAEPRDWSDDDLAFLRNVGDRLAAGVGRLDAEALQRTLNLELSHRMKNTLAMVMAIARQTLRSIPDQAPVEAFNARLQALSTAHMALLQQHWTAAKINEVVKGVVGAVEGLERFTISGPAVSLGARATLSSSLLLHELATNALKYGALSAPTGRVAISWKVADEQLIIEWRETGGPAITPPTHKGFGSRLIQLGLIGTGGVELRYLASGFEADFSAPLSQVQERNAGENR